MSCANKEIESCVALGSSDGVEHVFMVVDEDIHKVDGDQLDSSEMISMNQGVEENNLTVLSNIDDMKLEIETSEVVENNLNSCVVSNDMLIVSTKIVTSMELVEEAYIVCSDNVNTSSMLS